MRKLAFALLSAGVLGLSYGSAGAVVLQSSTAGQFALDATGLTLNSLSFADGVSSGTRNGATYSPDVVFSSGVSGLYGGTNSPNVSDSSLEIGPASGYNGLFVMDFAVDMAAVSFRSFAFDSPETISLFDNGNLIFTGLASTSGFPGFDGFVATGGLVFDRVVLDGSFYSIGDLTYGAAQVSAVPLPAALPLLVAGLAGLGVVGSRAKRKRAAAV